MRTLYSAGTGAFYLEGVNTAIPADAVPISADRHRELLAAQAAGSTIAADDQGRPVSIEPAAPSTEQLRTVRRAQIKATAELQILSVAPLWRQSNDNAALAQELLNRIDGIASPPELTAEVTAAVQRRVWINAIRAASDLIEADIAGMGAVQLAALDIAGDPRWPEIEEA